MSLVVSDTSPLTNLAAIGQFALLQKLYGSLLIAEAVWDELNAADQHWPGRDEVAASTWIQRHAPKNRLCAISLAGNARKRAYSGLHINACLKTPLSRFA